MALHKRVSTLGLDSAVHLHLKIGFSFQDSNVNISDREDRWFKRGVKEAIYVHLGRPSLNRGLGLRHHISNTYNATLRSIPRKFNHHQHLPSLEPNNLPLFIPPVSVYSCLSAILRISQNLNIARNMLHFKKEKRKKEANIA